MTTIAVAMLGIVLLATVVLLAVGVVHELTRSRRGRRWMRRRRHGLEQRADAMYARASLLLRLARRAAAARLDRPVPTRLARPALRVQRAITPSTPSRI